MSAGQISSHYARALLKFVSEEGCGEIVCRQARRLGTALDSLAELRHVISDPGAVKPAEKMDLLRSTLLPEDMAPQLEKFLSLVLKNGRIGDIRLILRSFMTMWYEANDIHFASIVTASDAPEWLEEKMKSAIGQRIGGKVSLEERVDPSIIGGAILTVDGYRLDASVSGQLQLIREKFIEKNKRIV